VPLVPLVPAQQEQVQLEQVRQEPEPQGLPQQAQPELVWLAPQVPVPPEQESAPVIRGARE